jgi:hypothetical protein
MHCIFDDACGSIIAANVRPLTFGRLLAQVHHTLEAYLDVYIDIAGLRDSGKTPLFRSAVRRTGTLTDHAMNRIDAWRMIQRRAAAMGLKTRINGHTFRATGITAYMALQPQWTLNLR